MICMTNQFLCENELKFIFLIKLIGRDMKTLLFYKKNCFLYKAILLLQYILDNGKFFIN